MTSQDRLTFCKYCKNKLFNSNIGLVCSLTKEKADFEKTCDYFSRDIDTLNKARQGKINSLFKTNRYNFLDLTKEIDLLNEFTVRENKFHVGIFLGVLSFFVITSSVVEEQNKDSWYLLMLFILTIIGVYSYKRSSKPILKISEEGIEICNKKITVEWKQVIRYYTYHKIVKSGKIDRKINFLVLEIFGYAEPIKINVNASTVKIGELLKIIEAVRRKYYVEYATLSFNELLTEIKDLKEE